MASAEPKTVVILFDTSLSMQWEKLERSYQALETLLRTLRPSDHFNLLLFNNQVHHVPTCPVAPPIPAACSALSISFAPASCGAAPICNACFKRRCSSAPRQAAAILIWSLLSDGGATRGPIQNGKLASWYADSWKQLAGDSASPHLHLRRRR